MFTLNIALPFFSLALYAVAVTVSAFLYWHYLQSRRKSQYLLFFLLMPLLLYFISLTVLLFPFMLLTIILLQSHIYVLLLYTPLIIFACRRRREFKCKREKKEKIDGIEYVVCANNVINAWFDWGARKFYISSRLRGILTDSEVKAVMLHEVAHAKRRFLNFSTTIIAASWYFVIATLIIFSALLLKTITNVTIALGLLSFFLLMAPSFTVIAMTWSWICEHESDLEALEDAGYEALASALAKVHIYGALKYYLRYVDVIRLNSSSLREVDVPSFLSLIKTLFKYSLDVPLWYLDLIKRPMYITHPPLTLRLTKLWLSHLS